LLVARLREEVGTHSIFLFFAQRFQICILKHQAIVRVLMKKAAVFVPTFLSHLPPPGHSQGSGDEGMLG
jgi:hypothetical protein